MVLSKYPISITSLLFRAQGCGFCGSVVNYNLKIYTFTTRLDKWLRYFEHILFRMIRVSADRSNFVSKYISIDALIRKDRQDLIVEHEKRR